MIPTIVSQCLVNGACSSFVTSSVLINAVVLTAAKLGHSSCGHQAQNSVEAKPSMARRCPHCSERTFTAPTRDPSESSKRAVIGTGIPVPSRRGQPTSPPAPPRTLITPTAEDADRTQVSGLGRGEQPAGRRSMKSFRWHSTHAASHRGPSGMRAKVLPLAPGPENC